MDPSSSVIGLDCAPLIPRRKGVFSGAEQFMVPPRELFCVVRESSFQFKHRLKTGQGAPPAERALRESRRAGRAEQACAGEQLLDDEAALDRRMVQITGPDDDLELENASGSGDRQGHFEVS